MSQAPFGRQTVWVSDIEDLGDYRVLRVAGYDGPKPEPGQFMMLSTIGRWGGIDGDRPLLPRAFSVARYKADKGKYELHFLLEAVGPGTQLLCELEAFDTLWLLGPLGRGFTAPTDARRAILVGGGVGIAPLAILQDELLDVHSTQAHTVCTAPTVLLGFRDEMYVQGAQLLADAQVATDDGSHGHHGLVTDLLERELDADAHATGGADPVGGANPVVYACGPPAMLESVRAMCAQRGVPAQLALESGMACGFGACFGCVVPKRDGSYARVCIDGPVIDAAELDHVDVHAGAPL